MTMVSSGRGRAVSRGSSRSSSSGGSSNPGGGRVHESASVRAKREAGQKYLFETNEFSEAVARDRYNADLIIKARGEAGPEVLKRIADYEAAHKVASATMMAGESYGEEPQQKTYTVTVGETEYTFGKAEDAARFTRETQARQWREGNVYGREESIKKAAATPSIFFNTPSDYNPEKRTGFSPLPQRLKPTKYQELGLIPEVSFVNASGIQWRLPEIEFKGLGDKTPLIGGLMDAAVKGTQAIETEYRVRLAAAKTPAEIEAAKAWREQQMKEYYPTVSGGLFHFPVAVAESIPVAGGIAKAALDVIQGVMPEGSRGRNLLAGRKTFGDYISLVPEQKRMNEDTSIKGRLISGNYIPGKDLRISFETSTYLLGYSLGYVGVAAPVSVGAGAPLGVVAGKSALGVTALSMFHPVRETIKERTGVSILADVGAFVVSAAIANPAAVGRVATKIRAPIEKILGRDLITKSKYIPPEELPGFDLASRHSDKVPLKSLLREAGKERTTTHVSDAIPKAFHRDGGMVLKGGEAGGASGWRLASDAQHFYKGVGRGFLAYLRESNPTDYAHSEGAIYSLWPLRNELLFEQNTPIKYYAPRAGESFLSYQMRVGQYSGETMIPGENIYGISMEKQVITPAKFTGVKGTMYPGSYIEKVKDWGFTYHTETPPLPSSLRGIPFAETLNRIIRGRDLKIHISEIKTHPLEGGVTPPARMPVLDLGAYARAQATPVISVSSALSSTSSSAAAAFGGLFSSVQQQSRSLSSTTPKVSSSTSVSRSKPVSWSSTSKSRSPQVSVSESASQSFSRLFESVSQSVSGSQSPVSVSRSPSGSQSRSISVSDSPSGSPSISISTGELTSYSTSRSPSHSPSLSISPQGLSALFTPSVSRKVLLAGLPGGDKQAGYYAEVKRAQEKKGKGHYKSRGFTRVNDKPLDYAGAWLLGASTADQYTNRSFRVVKANAPAAGSYGNELMRGMLERKFRTKKGQPNIFVELTNFAIDSYEEKQGIPYEAARQRKRKKSRLDRLLSF